jgi:hypothetical protein
MIWVTDGTAEGTRALIGERSSPYTFWSNADRLYVFTYNKFWTITAPNALEKYWADYD